jgi:hypothetical protein
VAILSGHIERPHNCDKSRGALNGAVVIATHWNTRSCHGTPRVTGIYVKLNTSTDPIRIGRLDAKTQSIDGKALSWAPVGLALNHASTIHAAQGKTINGTVYIDLGNVFEYGLLYVALSRATSPANITLSRRVTVNDLRVTNLDTFLKSFLDYFPT